MRIAIDASRTVVARRTGTERYSLELIRALLRLDQDNEYLLYFNQPPRPGLIEPAPNWRARVIPQRRLWTHTRLSWALLRDRPDLLFVPAHVLPLLHQCRSVATVHDLGFRFFPAAHPRLGRWYLELSTRWAALRASRLIAVSGCTATDLQRCYHVDPARVAIVYEGVDPTFAPVSDANRLGLVRQRHGLSERPYLLTVGTLQPRKNLGLLLRALRLLLDQGLDLQLAVAGRVGWGEIDLPAESVRLGLAGRFRPLGYVADEDLPALYSGALACVLPSLYEGFGLPALEAMACGTPVVAANNSALPEVVGPAGLLVDPRDASGLAEALRRLATEPDLHEQLARAGPARAATFTWERAARETLAVLEAAARD
jgi:glycosyltransferase involved in cell wall biosynthesis